MIEITVCDMRAADKAGYVAKLEGKDRQFLNAKSYSGHGVSAKNISYEISEEAYGLYEICDANYGNRKRRISYLAVTATNGWQEFEARKEAEAFIAPPPVTAAIAVSTPTAQAAPVAAAYPGLKAEAEPEKPPADVEVATCKWKDERWLQVKMKSDDAFKLFMPDMKNRVPGRTWIDASRSWLIPMDSALLFRELIEERTIRLNGIRKAMSFEVSGKAKEMMAMD
jgi:hypothetical protein